ncbi:MAG: DNA repair ATPase [Actinomycetota bacterium]
MTDVDEPGQGTYELLRDRLLGHAADIRRRAGQLNEARLEAFGQSRFEVSGSERIRTENNCVSRDIVAIGDQLLFGYNVFLGLRSETTVDDVFSLHQVSSDDGWSISPVDEQSDWLHDSGFINDLRELYTYYKDARLMQLRRTEGRLLAVFQTSDVLTDLRVFRWEVRADGTVEYLDNRGERDHTFPPQFDFEWQTVSREFYVEGQRRSYVSVLDKVFLDPLGGTLDIRLEDNTEDGQIVVSEPVDEPDQTLYDCEIAFAELGDQILLRAQPYREPDARYYVVNTLARTARREDAVGGSCQQLPDDHGVIHPGGIELRSGEFRSFDLPIDDMEFKTAIRSPNGEDVLYVFHERASGRSTLLAYNLIRREVATPIQCSGYGLFDDGTMVVFRQQDEPTRVHPMQIWTTPFVTDEFHARQPVGDTLLHRIGNAELVRGVSASLAIAKMVDDTEPSAAVFEDLARAATATLDAHYWLPESDAKDLAGPLGGVRGTAELIIDEFEKVLELRATADQVLADAEATTDELVDRIRTNPPADTLAFVEILGRLRRAQGELIEHRTIRYVDVERIEHLEGTVVEAFDDMSARAVEFLAGDEAFAGFHRSVDGLVEQGNVAATVVELDPITEQLESTNADLEILTEVIGALQVDDTTVRTHILEQVSETLGRINRARAILDARRNELRRGESTAAFSVEFALLSQTIASEIARVQTPADCDAALGTLMVQLENLEGTFGAFDEYLEQIATKREDVYESFATRKQQLLDERQRSAARLVDAADRILQSVRRRLDGFEEQAEINAYFASDPMVGKVRSIVDDLREIDEPVRADELAGRLDTARDEAARSLRDRTDIFEDGGQIIRFGRHRFSVDTQPLELTTAVAEGEMQLVLTGTDFREQVDDEDFVETRSYWDQVLPSETPEMARAVFLATSLWAADAAAVTDAAKAGTLLAHVQQAAEARFDEGYDRGVHDADAALILEKLADRLDRIGLLRIGAAPRALGVLWWASLDDETRRRLTIRGQSLGALRNEYPRTPAVGQEIDDLAERVQSFLDQAGLPLSIDARRAAEYVFEELTHEVPAFVVSPAAQQLHDAMWAHHDALLTRAGFESALAESITLADRYEIADAWLREFAAAARPDDLGNVPEAVAMVLAGDLPRRPGDGDIHLEVEGLLGQHQTIVDGTFSARIDELLDAADEFTRIRVPGFHAYQQERHQLLEDARYRLRLEEYAPKVMSGFVRNRLIDEVYLPLIGDNLAKQIGTVGEGRVDQMGLLLLISPPGYGKTTLMEYVANRLGMVFVKVNGPALGTGVTSLDPAEAPNATAAQEVDKINLALEMGNNVLVYLDDIQHTNPELLQKFISMTDAQRRMEGVWNGRTRTYDMRGKRFAVVMAGNPYTESGERFTVPDMLANRADTYNLGDVLGGREELFALSYLENCLTANTVLAPLAGRDRADVHTLLEAAAGRAISPDDLTHAYSAVELREITDTLARLRRVQEVVMAVNQAYIESASMEDTFRTEPPFQLQGSYRNMNRLAEKVLPIMSDDEVERLIDDHYLGEAQTLTSGAEANLLKLARLRDVMTPEEQQRWDEITRAFGRAQLLGGADDDPMVKVAGAVTGITEQLRRMTEGSGRDTATSPEPEAPKKVAAKKATKKKA